MLLDLTILSLFLPSNHSRVRDPDRTSTYRDLGCPRRHHLMITLVRYSIIHTHINTHNHPHSAANQKCWRSTAHPVGGRGYSKMHSPAQSVSVASAATALDRSSAVPWSLSNQDSHRCAAAAPAAESWAGAGKDSNSISDETHNSRALNKTLKLDTPVKRSTSLTRERRGQFFCTHASNSQGRRVHERTTKGA